MKWFDATHQVCIWQKRHEENLLLLIMSLLWLIIIKNVFKHLNKQIAMILQLKWSFLCFFTIIIFLVLREAEKHFDPVMT